MALLRVADYLQVESDRASAQLLEIRSLRSPFSFGEWKTHWSIKQVRRSHDDREAIVIDAYPQEVTTFVKTKRLLAGIQSELDHSWAVLGEVYGPVPELHGLGLTIRRVRSNLDDEAEYSKTVDFVPVPASFEAADADLLKLLINPLYGDKPDIGVRELIQNAVDAVRELHDFMQQHPHRVAEIEANLPDQAADVLVSPEKDREGGYWISITDKGKGMDVAIVQNYFLRVGASFRMSDAWKKEHEEKPGESRILRSGRFGIGVLAAFLIGKEIRVTSRHVDAERGVCFRAKIDTDPIELKHVDGAKIGTRICIRTDQKTFNKLAGMDLESEWYRLKWPSLEVNPKSREALRKGGERQFIPASGDTLDSGWYRLSVTEYEDVQWTFFGTEAVLHCNGIVVDAATYRLSLISKGFNLACPALSVFDPNGRLPLTLDRLRLRGELPFKKHLTQEVVRDVVAYAIVCAPTSSLLDKAAGWRTFNVAKHPAISENSWFATETGVGLLESSIIARAHRKNVIYVASDTESRLPSLFGLVDARPFMLIVYDFYGSSKSKTATQHWLRAATGAELPDYFPSVNAETQVLLGKTWSTDGLIFKGMPKFVKQRLQAAKDTSNAKLYHSDPDAEFVFDLPTLATSASGEMSDDVRIAEWTIAAPPELPKEKSIVAEIWHQYIPDVVPFDPEERKQLRESVYGDLQQFIDHWESRLAKTDS